MTRIGASLMGCCVPMHAAAEFHFMRQAGLSWVLIPVSQEAAEYQAKNLREMVLRARHVGLEVWLSPWGGGHFGGEGLDAGMDVWKWVDTVANLGPDVLHWDEPKVPAVHVAKGIDRYPDLRHAVTVAPMHNHVLGWEVETTAMRKAEIGLIDPYDQPTLGEAWVREGHHSMPGLWVQAFRVKEQDEERQAGVIARYLALHPAYVGIWGWRGSEGMGVLRSDRPDELHERLLGVIAAEQRVAA